MELRDEWQKLAKELEFDFVEGFENVLNIPAVQRTMKRELGGGKAASIEKLLASPILRTTLSTMFIAAVSGRCQDRDFILFRNVLTSGSSGTRHVHYVNVISAFGRQLNYGLKVKAAGVFSGIGKAVFPRTYIRPDNNPELDALVVVRGKQKAEIRSFLFSGKRMDKLKALISYSKKMKIDDYGIHFKEVGETIQSEKAKELMAIMASCANELD